MAGRTNNFRKATKPNKPRRFPKISLNVTYDSGMVKATPDKPIYYLYTGIPGRMMYCELFIEGVDPENPLPNALIKSIGPDANVDWVPIPLILGANGIITTPIALNSNQRITLAVDQPCTVWYCVLYKPELPTDPDNEGGDLPEGPK